MSAELSAISEHIQHYLKLRRFRDDPAHLAHLQRLKNWQTRRMKSTYAAQLQQPRQGALVEYFLQDIYRGLDLAEAANSLEKSLKLADRLFTSLRLIELALAFNTLNAQLDEQLCELLFEHMGCHEPDDTAYAEACRLLARPDEQFRALDLVRQFAEGLDQVIRCEGVYRAFRLARLPVRMSSLRGVYDLMDQGFTIMRALPQAEQYIQHIVAHEETLLRHIHAGKSLPFQRFDREDVIMR